MILSKIANELSLKVLACGDLLDKEVEGGYVSDMLSDVLANAKKGNIWITLQTHLNVISVACMKEISGIIIINGRTPDKEFVQKAEEEKLPVFSTGKTAFKIAGRLYELGIGKDDEDI